MIDLGLSTGTAETLHIVTAMVSELSTGRVDTSHMVTVHDSEFSPVNSRMLSERKLCRKEWLGKL